MSELENLEQTSLFHRTSVRKFTGETVSDGEV